MSTLPYRNEIKMAEVREPKLHMACHLLFLMFIDGTVSHVLYGYYDIMLFTKGEGPHLWTIVGQAGNSILMN